MKKRIISLLLALSMMISLVPVSALSDTGGGIAPLAAGSGSRTTNSNGSTISGGVYDDNISNYGRIEGGTFNGQVTNWYSGQIHHGIFNNDVWNDGLIMGGTFKGTVTNYNSSTGVPGIANGTGYKPIFVGKVINEGTVNGGIFLGDFVNETTTTSGNAVTGKVKNGIFKDDPEIDNVKSITVNGAAIKEVGYCDATEYGMSWGTTVYAASGTSVVIRVDTKVNAINGKAPSEFNGGLYDDGQMIIFTMPDEPVVLSYIAPKDLQFGEDGKPTAASGNGWTYDGTTLTLTSGEWNFLNDPEIRCNVDINKDAVLKDGTINATVKNYGTIEGGTIRLCDNYGTIVNGTFDNPNKLYCIWNYNLISGGIFEQGIQACVGDGMASKITGGTFKSGFYTSGSGEGTTVTGGTFASPPTNATGEKYSVSIGRWSGKCSIAINGVDFGENKSVYVVGQDYNDVKITATAFDTYVDANTNKTKKFKEWQISPTGATLNAVDGGTADLTQKEIEFFMPDSYKNITLAAKYETVTTPTYDENLIIGTDGKPNTANSEPYGNGWKGANWTYDGTTLTLSGSSWSFSKYPAVTCPVALSRGTALYGGVFENTVSGSGYITGGIFLNTVTVSAENINTGIFKTAPNGTTYYTVKAGDSSKLGVKVNGAEFVDFGTDEAQVVNRIGNFEFSVQLRDANGDVVEITNINGKEIGSAYGSHYMNGGPAVEFTMPSENVVLNQEPTTKTYTLTLTDATANPDKAEYDDGDEITLTAKDAAEGKEFDKWELDGLTLKDGYQETDATIKVTITGKATAKATYKGKAPTTYTLTVENGYIGDDETKASGNYEANAEIKVTAKAKTGYHFTKWTVEEGTLSLSEEEQKANPLTFEMPDGAVSLKANYEEDTPDPVDPNPDDQPKTYTVTAKGGTINNETEVKAEKDIKLTVDVDEKEVPEGMTFDVWSIRFPKGIEDTLTPSVNLHDPHMTFTMPEADITIEAQYRSSELPGEDDGPSTLGTMATVAVGGAAAGILVWQGVSLGVDSYLQLNLPKGVAVPANRRELVVLLWETAGKPEAALPSLYSDVPAEEIELQKATHWAIDNGLVKPADDSDASRFDPDRYVTKYDVFGAWLKLKKLMK